MNPGKKTVPLRLLGLFLVVLGAKLLVVGNYGNPTPYWDQWEAEAATLYHPSANGNLGLAQFVAAHHEHRILWVRLLGLLELKLNGGIWDPLFQMTVNAALHGLALVLLLGCLHRELPERSSAPLVFFALLLTLPFGWENTLAGFQSQFYFFLLFGLSSIWLLTRARPLSAWWWLGFLALIASYFSVASGFLAGVAAVACNLFQMAGKRRLDKPTCIGVGLVLGYVLLAYGWTPTVEIHHHLKAGGIRDFAVSFFKTLAFPFCARPSLALVVQLPAIALLALLAAAKRARLEAAPPWFLIGAILFVWLNAAATAYGRGAGGVGPAPRYVDTLFFGLVLNGAALLYLAPLFRGRWMKVAALGWLAVLVSGTIGIFAGQVIHHLRLKARAGQTQEANVKRFLSDFDRDRLASLPFHAIPHPSAERLAYLLENETVRSFLPTPLRAALPARQTNNWFFLESGAAPAVPPRPFERVWGSYGPGGPALAGELALDFDPPRKGGFLEIAVAGQPRAPGMALRLETPDGRPLADLAPRRAPGNRWRPVCVRAPAEAFRIAAVDASPRHWLAFSAPKEIGPGTLLTRATLRAWFMFLAAGIALLAWTLLPAAGQRVKPQCGPSGQ